MSEPSTGSKRGNSDGDPMTPVKLQKTNKATPDRAKAAFILAGDRSKPNSFFSDNETEAAVGRYLGYTDTGGLRKFILSHHFLDFYLRYSGTWSNNLAVRRALPLIRDEFLDYDSGLFPLDLGQIDLYKPTYDGVPEDTQELTEYRQQQARYLAHILILIVQYLSGPGSLKIVKEEQETALVQLHASYTYFTPPDFSAIAHVRAPDLKTGFEESDLEAYDRAWILLRYAGHALMESMCSQLNRKGWDAPGSMPDSYTPSCMRDNPTTRQGPKPLNITKNLKKIAFNLTWSQRGQSAEQKTAFQEYLEASDQDLPEKEKVGSGDPRVHTKAQYRDSIRHDFECGTTRLKIVYMRMVVPVVKTDDEDDDEIAINLENCAWDKVRARLAQACGAITVTVKFEPLNEAENLEDIFESPDEPPPQIAHLFPPQSQHTPGAEADEASRKESWTASRLQ